MSASVARLPVASEPRPATPFHTRAWLRATGVTPTVLEAGNGQALGQVLAWSPPAQGHYFHDPRQLLSGANEHRFLPGRAAEQAAIGQALAVDAVTTIAPYGYRGGPSTGAGLGRRALQDLAASLVEHAREAGAGLVCSHYLYAEDDRDWIEALSALGGVTVVMGAHCRMAVPWADIDGYHAWLGKRRRSTRSATAWGRTDASLDWIVHDGPGLPPELLSCPELCRPAHADAAPAPDALLRQVAAGQDFDRAILAVLDADRTLRGALMVLRHGDELYPKFVGSRAMREDYIPLVFNRLTQYAIAQGVSRINYGGGAHQAKLFRGARLVEALGVLVFLDPALRRAIEPWARDLGQAKRAHFSALSARWSVRAPPPAASARSRQHG